jgi:hypothetical protein
VKILSKKLKSLKIEAKISVKKERVAYKKITHNLPPLFLFRKRRKKTMGNRLEVKLKAINIYGKGFYLSQIYKTLAY